MSTKQFNPGILQGPAQDSSDPICAALLVIAQWGAADMGAGVGCGRATLPPPIIGTLQTVRSYNADTSGALWV